MARGFDNWIRMISGGGVGGGRPSNLSVSQAGELFEALLNEAGTEAQVAALFVALRQKGSSSDELAGFAGTARRRLEFPWVDERTVVVATSRLGKLRYPPMALASAAAASAAGAKVLIQASCGVPDAGLTLGDLWQQIVGPIQLNPSQASHDLQRIGLACWSPTAMDPGWQRLLRIEEEIGMRCVPDVITKLLAPDRARLLVAAMAGPVLGTAGDAMDALGHDNGLIIQGVEGSVDPSVTQRTRGLTLEDGGTYPLRIQPEDFGFFFEQEAGYLHEDRFQAAKGANMEALMGQEGPALATAALGAALILRLAGLARDLATAVGCAREALESGSAHHRLMELKGIG
ncbi:MAG: hypothetical protein DWQ01_20160 [Planctomycetota bacterium]|nr:MAG: hypothetical protein DWQ01_20160 [Planctomycetota bacterium]